MSPKHTSVFVHHLVITCRVFQLRISINEVEIPIPFFQSLILLYLSLRGRDDSSLSIILILSTGHLFAENLSRHITTFRDISVHNRECLIIFSDTSVMGRKAKQFADGNLSQPIDFPTCMPRRPGDYAHTLDLIFSSIFSSTKTCIFLSLLANWIIVLLNPPSTHSPQTSHILTPRFQLTRSVLRSFLAF